jgi:hypothetical protein
MNTNVPIDQSPFATNFGVALAVENLDRETVASAMVLLTENPKDPTKLFASIRFSSASSTQLIALTNAFLEEIEKPTFADLWEDNAANEEEEEEEA